MRAKPSYPRLQRTHPLAAGLVGCYPMCEGGGKTLQDLSGVRHGSLAGTTLPAWASALNGWGLYLDGSPSYVSLPFPPFTAPPFSVCALFRELDTRSHVLWWYGNSSGNWNAHYLQYNGTTGSAGATTVLNSTFCGTSANNGGLTLGQWKVCGGVWTSANSRTSYLNGVPAATNTVSSAPTGFDTHAIGLCPFSPTVCALGTIGAVMLWNRALSDGEMALAAQDLLAVVRPRRFKPFFAAGFQPVWTEPSTVHLGWGL